MQSSVITGVGSPPSWSIAGRSGRVGLRRLASPPPHAFEAGKEFYVIWKCAATPSPFISETATKVFKRPDEAIAHFQERGYLPAAAAPASGHSGALFE